MRCPYSDVCRLLPGIPPGEVRDAVVRDWCDSDGYTYCERYKLKAESRIVPLDLMPDGSVLAC